MVIMTTTDYQMEAMDHHLEMIMEIMVIMDHHRTMIQTILHQLCIQELEHMPILCKPTFDQEQQGETYVVMQKISSTSDKSEEDVQPVIQTTYTQEDDNSWDTDMAERNAPLGKYREPLIPPYPVNDS